MSNKPVFLAPDRPLAFLDDACTALAEALEETPAFGAHREELAAVYAEVALDAVEVAAQLHGRLQETTGAL